MVNRNYRGRGQGRGRGRGRSHRGGRNVSRDENNAENTNDEVLWQEGDDSVEACIRNLFLHKSTFDDHYKYQKEYSAKYFACLHVLLKHNIEIRENSKSLALAVTWALKDYKKAEYLLQIPGEKFHIKEVLKALSILDAGRNKRAQEKLLRRLETQGCKKKKKLASIKSVIATPLVQTNASLSGTLIGYVKTWLKTIPAERFEFFAKHFPVEPWKKLVDLLHAHPENDVPQCPWFLPFCFGKPMPDTVSDGVITEENISEMIAGSDIDYTVARKWKDGINEAAKKRIATYSPINTVLWYYEELSCTEVDEVLLSRFNNGEEISLPYGKLMERLLYFKTNGDKPFTKYLIKSAEEKLKKLSFQLEEPVVVIGDMSASMDVAIRTSNIVASLLTCATNADLVFFDEVNVVPPFIPKDIEGVMKLCDLIRSRNNTAPAASLYPFYEQKRIVKTFVVVTDEEENTDYKGYRFAPLFKKYYEKVFPARLVFISFLRQNDPGQMLTSLKSVCPNVPVMQFRFDSGRPDLTKLDNVFGVLSLGSEAIAREIEDTEGQMAEQNFEQALKQLKV